MSPPVDNSGPTEPDGPKGPSVGPKPADDQLQVALKEYLERVDRGDAVDRDAFLAQRPEIADELRSFIDAEDQVRKLAQPSERESTSTQSFAVDGQETIAPQRPVRRASEGSGLKQQFGRYRIIKALGKGAMGMVYLAEDSQLERQVALKTPHFEQEPTPELLERFYREARAAANLRHPNICPVHDVGQIEGTHYISMAYIDGHPLSAFIRAKPQPERQILIVVRKLAQALEEAHERGIVHRDLKPANIMVDKRNEPIIMDFGLARNLEREQSVRITQSGMLIGTPAYMSPEQIEGEPDKVGRASDQFSLGVILYELLTGQLPFRGSLSAVMAQIITKDPTLPSQLRPDLDLRIEALCQKMLAKDPANRFPSLAAVAEEIASILRNPGGKQTSAASASDQPAVVAPAADPNVLASSARQSTAKKTLAGHTPLASLAAKDLVSLEELARKCLMRHDYDQVVQIIDRIPARKRTPALNELLQTASQKADEISYLVVEIDEAVRFRDRAAALKKADELLKVKPGHHRALEVQQDFAGHGEGGLRLLKQFTRPWNEGGWIPWSALALGLAVFGVMLGVVIIWLGKGKGAIVIDTDVAGVTVAVKDQSALITVPGTQRSIEVSAGDHLLMVSYQGLETQTKSFTLKKDEKKILNVHIAGSDLVAYFDGETPPTPTAREKPEPAKIALAASAAHKDAAGKLAGAGREIVPNPPVVVPPRPKPAGLAAPFSEEAARSARAQWAGYLQQPGELTNKIGMKLELIPPGQFLMGSTGPDPLQHPQQKPPHKVHISHSFYIGTYEVTRREFAKFVAATGFVTEAEKNGGKAAGVDAKGDMAEQANLSWKKPGFRQTDAHPVVIVSWNDATAFCRWLSEKEGQTYRLPTEAEWEYACRAGTLTPFISGSHLNDVFSVGNGLDATFRQHFHMSNTAKDTDVRPSDGFVFTAPVGSYRANAFGLCDMHGNVWEWCQDWYRAPYSPAEVTDPTGAAEGSQRVTRGGGFDCGIGTTSASRDHINPTHRYANIGFRVVRDTVPIPSTPEAPQTTPPTATQPPVVSAEQGAGTTAAPAPGFVSLFNGRDLTGWQKDPIEPGDWHVEKGNLVGGSLASCLYTDRADYKDFHLHIELRLTGDESGAVCVRTQIPEADAKSRMPTSGYQVILCEPDDPKVPRTGTVYGLGNGPNGPTQTGFRNFDKRIDVGQWFTLDVYVEGRNTLVRLNGEKVLENPWKKKQYPAGRIALMQDLGKPSVQYRKIEISDLRTGTEPPVDKAVEPPPIKIADVTPGFVPLFNGRDLSGWKTHETQPRGWHVENGVLIGKGPSRSHLYSERGDYRDFHLRVEAKINKGGNSGVFGRATFGPRWPLKTPQWPVGYEAQILDYPGDATQTGSLYITDRGAAVVHVRESLVPTGEWFIEELIVEGDRIIVKVNGKTTADYRDSRPIDRGYIALQLHDANTKVEFRKIEIRELGQPAPPPTGTPPTATTPTGTIHPDAPAILAAPFDESAATAIQQLWAEQLKAPIEATNSIGMHLRLIPPGEFRMGDRRKSDEGPEHDVAITRPMYVGTHEVTKGEFTKFAAATAYKTRAETVGGAWLIKDSPKTRKWFSSKKHTFHDAGFAQDFSHPVIVVSWDDAQAFCAWLSQKEGRHYRLPTEAEWEYFCRAGTTTAAYSGDDDERLTTVGNVADATARQKFPTWTATRSSDAFLYTSPVGKFRANNFGLFDTIGNATEWCADWYAADYYANSPKNDPPGPAAGTKHVARGGSFTNVPSAAQRWHYTPDHRAFDCGFRVVCEIPANGSPPPFASTTAVAPPARIGGRHLWNGQNSKFENRHGRSWRETITKDGKVYNFLETSKTSEHIELIDRSRGGKAGVRVRLCDDRALIIFGGKDKDWHQLQSGQWESAPKPQPSRPAPADNLLANGSFEDGPKGLGDFMTFHPESKVITGWIVTRASIDLIGLGRASNGQRSIDLHGSPGYGGIKQTFHTTAGQRYRVTFTLSCNPEAKFKTKRIAVEVAGTTETFTVDGSGTTWDKLRWDPHAFEFKASSEDTTIEFHTLENRDPIRGPMIDDVRVTPLP